MERLNLNESVKSSEHTGSSEPSDIGFNGGMSEEQIAIQRRRIVELSNESVLHGFDLAIQLVEVAGQLNAAVLLKANRQIIEIGLKNGIPSQIHEITKTST